MIFSAVPTFTTELRGLCPTAFPVLRASGVGGDLAGRWCNVAREPYGSWIETIIFRYLKWGEVHGIHEKLPYLPFIMGAVVLPLLVSHFLGLSKKAGLLMFLASAYLVMPILVFVLVARAHLRKVLREEAENTKPKVAEP